MGKPSAAADALALANDELHAALPDLEAQLARGGGKGEVRLGPDGELIIPPLTAEDVPAEPRRQGQPTAGPAAQPAVRDPVKGKSLTAAHLSRYFARG